MLTNLKEYEAADDVLKECLPPVVNSLLSILPMFLQAQIEIQNALLAHCYTTLHNYCQDHSLPSPAPELDEIVAMFHADFDSLRKEAEQGLRMIAQGKSIHQSMDQNGGDRKKSYSGLNIRNGISNRRGSSQASVPTKSTISSPYNRNGRSPSPQPPPPGEKPRMGSYSSTNSLPITRTNTDGITRWPSGGVSPYAHNSSAGSEDDYFSGARPTGTGNPYSSTPMTPGSIAGKKKPPPPPPKKFPSQQMAQYVTALYDFDGQGEGDLAFREGDRIKVVKKTESEMDWWEGELRGRKGAFPANYCKAE